VTLDNKDGDGADLDEDGDGATLGVRMATVR
jgi:hypothetical protein